MPTSIRGSVEIVRRRPGKILRECPAGHVLRLQILLDRAQLSPPAEIDDGSRPGVSTEESAELKGRKRENAELKRAILKPASAFFVERLEVVAAATDRASRCSQDR